MTHPMLPLIGLYLLTSLVRLRLDQGVNKTDEPIRRWVGRTMSGKAMVRFPIWPEPFLRPQLKHCMPSIKKDYISATTKVYFNVFGVIIKGTDWIRCADVLCLARVKMALMVLQPRLCSLLSCKTTRHSFTISASLPTRCLSGPLSRACWAY